MQYSIRLCEKKNIPRLIELCEHHARYEGARYEEKNKCEQLQKLLFDPCPRLHCWIVEANNKIIGYASYTFDYSTWDAALFLHLDCLYLEEGFRGFGIGEEIVRRLRIVAKENGCVNIQWQTPAFNDRAVKFYQRIGAAGKEKIRFSLTL